MDAETRTRDAIEITRVVLKSALASPFTLAVMTVDDLDPDAIEDQVMAILCYLEKTKPEKPEEAGD